MTALPHDTWRVFTEPPPGLPDQLSEPEITDRVLNEFSRRSGVGLDTVTEIRWASEFRIHRLPAVQRRLWMAASQLGIGYRGGPLAAASHRWMPGLRPGDRMPDIRCARTDGVRRGADPPRRAHRLAWPSGTRQTGRMAEPGAVVGVERHGRPRDPGNDAAILEAALDLLIERGAVGTSIEAVAQRAGVAKLTVYRRWRTKEDLLMAALEHVRNPDMDAPAAGQSIDDLVAFIAELLSRPRFRALMARVIGASVDDPNLVSAYTARYLRPRLDALVVLARQAVDDGRFPPGTDPGVVQDILAGSIGSVLLQHEEEMTREQIERRLRMLLHHIGYRP